MRSLLRKYLSEKLDDTSYQALVGCWNCDETYNIMVKKGKNCPQYLIKAKLACRKCGCDSLKPHFEYINEREIMKDVILHHRVQQMEEKEPKEPSKDHVHFQ